MRGRRLFPLALSVPMLAALTGSGSLTRPGAGGSLHKAAYLIAMTATADIEPLAGLTLVADPITGYHGSRGNREFEADKFKGVWFAEDKAAEILNYYATRDNQRTVIEAEIRLGRNIDLSMYNADEKCGLNYAGSFLRDTGMSDRLVNSYLDIFFDDFVADYDDDG